MAAKNDASYDLSSAASVTGQTTIAASTATTTLPNGRIVTARFAGALFLSAFLRFVLEQGGQEHPAHARRHTDGVEHAPPWH